MTFSHVYCPSNYLFSAQFRACQVMPGYSNVQFIHLGGHMAGWMPCPRIHHEENNEGLNHATLLDTNYQAFAGLSSEPKVWQLLARKYIQFNTADSIPVGVFHSTHQLYHKPRPSLLIQLFFLSWACKLTNTLIRPTKYRNLLPWLK